MPLFIAIVILAVLSSTLIMLRINKREDEVYNQQEDEDNEVLSGDVIDMRFYHGGIEDDDILNSAN